MTRSGSRRDASSQPVFPDLMPARAHWRLVAAAFNADMSPGGALVLVPVASVSAYVVTGQYLWLAWGACVVAAMAVRLRVAAVFLEDAQLDEAALWTQRHRIMAWAQSALLGLGGAAAIILAGAAASLIILGCLAFLAAAQSAAATLEKTAKGQALLTLGPFILAGLAAGHVWAFAVAVVGLAELGSCMLMLRRSAALALAASVAQSAHEESALSGAAPNPVQDFQRLLGRDQVTGLPNRQAFMHILAAESRRAHDASMPLSLLLISLEGLPEFDEATQRKRDQTQLAAAVARIHGALYRVMDQMACLSPGRLAVVLPFTDALGADVVAHRISEALRRVGELGEASIGLWGEACIGAATYAGKGVLPEAHLLECALSAESTARKKGGDHMARFDPLADNMRWAGPSRARAQTGADRRAVVPPPLALAHDFVPPVVEKVSESDFANGEPF